ncbi:MAG: carbohydrate binding domain-containing protein, partial [Planctomycetes bacterium]|nr:carbohydrate binding domain-containing protein [Planctomycetota bacterium]
MNKRVCCFVVFALMSELVVSCVWSQENQIINSEFDDGLNAWGSYGAAGFTIEVVRDAGLSGKNGALLDVTDASAGGAIGLAQSGLLLEPGVTYPIGFTARAEQDREMVLLLQTNLNSVSWPTQVNQKMNLTTKPQEYFFEYTHSGNTYGDEAGETVTLYLMLKGAFWPMVGDDLNKKVWFDRVYFGAEPPQPRRDLADDPNPGDQSTDVPRITDLSWQPGIHADTHDVYLGANFDDVNTADPSNPLGVLVSQGQEAMSYGPESVFDFEQIYYWRVDEVNGAPDFTVYKGDVWSFEVEPLSIPIRNITATASSSFGISGPEKTIDGSGLADDLHG